MCISISIFIYEKVCDLIHSYLPLTTSSVSPCSCAAQYQREFEPEGLNTNGFM